MRTFSQFACCEFLFKDIDNALDNEIGVLGYFLTHTLPASRWALHYLEYMPVPMDAERLSLVVYSLTWTISVTNTPRTLSVTLKYQHRFVGISRLGSGIIPC